MIMKGCESLLNETVFISFKCTTAENIYLFIISRLSFTHFFSIIELSHPSSSPGLISSGVELRIVRRRQQKAYCSPANDTCDCSHDTNDSSVESASWEIKPSKCVNNCKSHFYWDLVIIRNYVSVLQSSEMRV